MDTIQRSLAAAATGLVGLHATYISPWLWRQLMMQRIRRKLMSRRVLVLTYDDGPHGSATPELLDVLAGRYARATFFMLGQQAHQHPQIVERVLSEGHQIGCHSYRHLNAWKVLPGKAIEDVELGYEHLASWIPRNAPFRPPYGKLTLQTKNAVLRQGAPIVWWTIDSCDSCKVLPSPTQAAQKLRQDGGGIVLLHDGSMTPYPPERKRYTLAATAALLDIAEQESIATVTIGELLK